MKLKPIKEQVVVIFGASSGIGRQTALRFAQRGARVVVAPGRSPTQRERRPARRARGGGGAGRRRTTVVSG